MKINVLVFYAFLIFPLATFAQVKSKNIDDIIKNYRDSANNVLGFSVKLIDLDNDNDLDYIFSFGCGEGNCLRVHLNINGNYKKVIDEFGHESFYFTDAIKKQASNLVLNAINNHCCGESPFGSNRDFSFTNNKVLVKNNYVSYNHEIYNDEDNTRLTLIPDRLLNKTYEVNITLDNYNVRFSADLESHNATFTCPEKTNIIAKLNKGTTVKVLGEFKGNDYKERTWLYVEIPNKSINSNKCSSPINYGFAEQKLRGWISNKYAEKK